MAARKQRILLVEDEPALVGALRFQLQREGYDVRVAPDGPTAVAAAERVKPDLVLLDLMLPGIDGLEVCRRIRRSSPVPIIMVTARSRLADKVAGLEEGADDYLTKPILWPELRARIRAVLRRAAEAPPVADGAAPIAVAGLLIDPKRHSVRVGEREVALRAKEMELLAFLAQNAGHVLTREQIMQRVWGVEQTEDTRTVDVHIRWLREKIEDDPGQPKRLQTIRNVGYRLVE